MTALHETISNDNELDAALEPLHVEWQSLMDRIEQIDGPTTMAGARAMARAALALTPRNLDGDLQVGSNPEDWFHLCVAQFLAGGNA